MKLFIQAAPSWWPYHFVNINYYYTPPRGSIVLVDNGAFKYYLRGVRPTIEVQLHRLRLVAQRLARVAREVWVILPDYPFDTKYTLEAARRAKELCSVVKCIAVAHTERGLFAGFMRSAEELAAIDHVHGLAAPLKLPCRLPSRGKSPAMRVSRQCQVEVARQVCGVARHYGIECHGLGAILVLQHLRRLAQAGITSIDSVSWIWSNPYTKNKTKDMQLKTLLDKLAPLLS